MPCNCQPVDGDVIPLPIGEPVEWDFARGSTYLIITQLLDVL
jgi:hypothetical protein